MPEQYRVIWSPEAQRGLDRLPEKVAAALVEMVFGSLRSNPQRVGRPLQLELAGRHVARRGSYRIVYRIDDAENILLSTSVGHRRDVYRA